MLQTLAFMGVETEENLQDLSRTKKGTIYKTESTKILILTPPQTAEKDTGLVCAQAQQTRAHALGIITETNAKTNANGDDGPAATTKETSARAAVRVIVAAAPVVHVHVQLLSDAVATGQG